MLLLLTTAGWHHLPLSGAPGRGMLTNAWQPWRKGRPAEVSSYVKGWGPRSREKRKRTAVQRAAARLSRDLHNLKPSLDVKLTPADVSQFLVAGATERQEDPENDIRR